MITSEEPVITSTKEKDPKRVEAGRRLGQISRQIREQKVRDKIEAEMAGWDYGYLIRIAGLIIAGVSVYYARAEHVRETRELVKPPIEPKNVDIKLDSL